MYAKNIKQLERDAAYLKALGVEALPKTIGTVSRGGSSSSRRKAAKTSRFH